MKFGKLTLITTLGLACGVMGPPENDYPVVCKEAARNLLWLSERIKICKTIECKKLIYEESVKQSIDQCLVENIK